MTTTETTIDCGYCPACYADLKQEWLVRQWQAANLGTEGAI